VAGNPRHVAKDEAVAPRRDTAACALATPDAAMTASTASALRLRHQRSNADYKQDFSLIE